MIPLHSVRNLLKPLVRLYLQNGAKYQEVSEQLRRAFVEIGQETLKASGKVVTVSKLSVLTGLQRKDLGKLMSSDDLSGSSVNLLSKIIGQWRSHPDYCGADNQGRPLTVQGADSEFAELVRSITADINPYTVLFGLEQSQVIEYEAERVKLTSKILVNNKDLASGFDMLAADLQLLSDCVESNLKQKSNIPNLHLTTDFDNVIVSATSELRDWLLDEGTAFHEKVRAHISRLDKDANPRLHRERGGVKVAICAFSSVEEPKEG